MMSASGANRSVCEGGRRPTGRRKAVRDRARPKGLESNRLAIPKAMPLRAPARTARSPVRAMRRGGRPLEITRLCRADRPKTASPRPIGRAKSVGAVTHRETSPQPSRRPQGRGVVLRAPALRVRPLRLVRPPDRETKPERATQVGIDAMTEAIHAASKSSSHAGVRGLPPEGTLPMNALYRAPRDRGSPRSIKALPTKTRDIPDSASADARYPSNTVDMAMASTGTETAT